MFKFRKNIFMIRITTKELEIEEVYIKNTTKQKRSNCKDKREKILHDYKKMYN